MEHTDNNFDDQKSITKSTFLLLFAFPPLPNSFFFQLFALSSLIFNRALGFIVL